MNNIVVLVENINGKLVTTSNRVAEELGVQHKDLLEKIDKYISKFNSAELSAQFYISSNYKDRSGKSNRNYLITKKGIAQLVGGYSSAVEKAFDLNVAYINRFEEMEKTLENNIKVPTTLTEALALALEQAKELERKEKQIVELAPKASYYDNILVPSNTYAISHIAKDLGISANKLNKVLSELKIQYNPKTKYMAWALYSKYDWLIPNYCDYEDYQGDNMIEATKRLKWTQQGRKWIIELLDEKSLIEWYDGKPRFKQENKTVRRESDNE